MLYAMQNRRKIGDGFSRGKRRHSNESVQLIDCSIAIDAKRLLSNALSTGEMSFTLVAHFRINTIQRNTRRVELGIGHRVCGSLLILLQSTTVVPDEPHQP